ncbi:hypothetical protein RRG08_017483 [Elysia crispata]|uniref:Uncharacterized protein n=1 Tax=Elysia crispata TaxID=231223 RepID=A0AAE1CYZ1_9GAST|nr:hypothetical protein RRG08_017483 [Elysia crispata]
MAAILTVHSPHTSGRGFLRPGICLPHGSNKPVRSAYLTFPPSPKYIQGVDAPSVTTQSSFGLEIEANTILVAGSKQEHLKVLLHTFKVQDQVEKHFWEDEISLITRNYYGRIELRSTEVQITRSHIEQPTN